MATNTPQDAAKRSAQTMNNEQEAQASEAKPVARHSFLIGSERDDEHERPSNEYVLNVAFFSFLGFTLVQTGFAISAKSSAMLVDSEAMFVDAFTYLFNLLAERLKHRPYSDKEKRMPADLRHHRRRLTRLYLELIPPFISVSTLLVVTIFAVRDSVKVLLETEPTNVADSPDIYIMMLFSALNLGLDVVNVMCFARVDQAVGLKATGDIVGAHHHPHMDHPVIPSETTPLKASSQAQKRAAETDSETHFSDDASTDSEGLNLNMCSAWTHVCADTLRSVAVFVAAGIAYLWNAVTPDAAYAYVSLLADAYASLMVSIIIIVSLGPLLQGLYYTALEIKDMTIKGHQLPAEVTLNV